MIAQVPVEWSQIGIWLGCLAAVMLMLKLGLDIWKDHFRAPDPYPPLHKEFASSSDHKKLGQRLDKHIEDTDRRFAAMATASSAGREKIYLSLRELEKKMERMDERTKNTGDEVKTLSSRMNDWSDEFLAALPATIAAAVAAAIKSQKNNES